MDFPSSQIDTASNSEHPLRVTEGEIWEAANKLWANKIEPTAIKIREYLGGRGSYRTIQLYLTKWRKQPWELPNGDDPLWQELVKMRKKYEQQASTLAAQKIQIIQQDCELKINTAQEHQLKSEQKLESISSHYQELTERFSKLNDDHQSLSKEFNDEDKKRSFAEHLNTVLEKDLIEEKQQTEKRINYISHEYEEKLIDVKKQLEQFRRNYEEKILAIEKQKEEQVQSLQNQITEERLKNKELEQSSIHYIEKENLYISEINKLNDNILKYQDDVEKYKAEHQYFSEIKQQYEKEQAITEEKIKQLQIKLDYFISINHNLQLQLNAYCTKIGQLQEKLTSSDDPSNAKLI